VDEVSSVAGSAQRRFLSFLCGVRGKSEAAQLGNREIKLYPDPESRAVAIYT